MKRNFKGFITGMMTALLLFGSVSVMAAPSGVKQAIEVTYNNYKTFIMGTPYTAKNALGEVIEPFEYNGSIYVPMETIMAALQENGMYDPAAKSIHIGVKKQPADITYLSDLQYSDFKTGDSRNSIELVDGNYVIADRQGNTYENGMLFNTTYYADLYTHDYLDDDSVIDDPDYALAIVSYPLNRQYKSLSGAIILPLEAPTGDETNKHAVDVLFYGDGNLLYSAKQVNTSRAHNFSINIANISTLSIKIVGSQKYVNSGNTINHTLLTNLQLSN